MRTNVLNNLSNVVEKGTSKVQVGNKLMAGVPRSEVGRISEEGAIEHPLSTHSAPFGIRWKPAFNMHKTPSTPSRFARLAAMVTLLLTLACMNVWADTTVSATQFTASQSGTTYTVSAKSGYGDLSGVTVTTVGTSGGVTSNRLKVPAGTLNFSVSSGNIIKSITVTWRNSSNQYPTSNSELTATVGTVSTSSQTSSWTGSAQSVSLTNTTSNTFQVIGLSITYGSSSGPTTYTVTYNGNGNTGGSVPTDSNSPYEEADEVTVLGNTGSLVKTNYTFTGWNTAANGSGTHYDVDDTFTMGTSNVTLYAEWQYSFTTHSPGTYTASVGSGGYGKTLKTVSSRDYEVYLFSASSSKGTLYAGSASSITDGKALFSGVAANAEGVASDGWLIAKASTYAGSGSTNVNEFSGSSGALTTHYAGITSAQSIKMKISGYDQFSMIGRDGSTTSGKGKFIVKVDGVSQSITATTTDNNVYRFDISTGTHIIEITADGTDNVSRFRGFSLRLPAAACVAPSSVGITGTNKYLGGQTISLTATPVGGSGTATYQWQKEINSVWTNLENGGNISGATTNNLLITGCTHQNSGQYRCIVSTGATCSTTSSAYGVHVFSIYGKYYSGEYSHNEITWTSGTTGTATIHLNASSTYLFKVWSNDGYYYGNGSNNYIIQPVNWDCGTGNDEMRLLTGPEGDYTFTVNIEHGLDGSPYVNVQVGYPTVSHPSTGYMYITKWWDHCYVHYWEGTNNDLSPWGYDPEINSDRYVNICGTNYWYFPVIDTYNKVIAKDAAGDPSNTTGDQVSTDHGGKYITHDGSWGWHDFSTYTITYTGNGGGGSMSATSGICPDADQAITSNAFTAPTGCASFAHWTANVAVKVGGATVAAGSPIANGATIEDINSDITLTAVWKLAAPTITDNGDNTFSISGSMAGSSYYYTTNGGTPTTSSSLYSSAVDFSAGEANITAKAIAHKDGYVDSDVASQACTYHAAVTCTGNPTALVSGTLYQVSDMASACLGEITGTGQYFYGLSSNGKFYINGTTNSNNASTGTVEIKTASNTIDKIEFTGIAWFKGAGTNTCRSIKFVVPSAGTLTIYGKTSSGNGNVVIKTESSGNTTVIANSVNAYASGSTTVSAGTYYVLSDGGSAAIVGLKFVESACTTPAAPTAFANTAVTSTTATFSITDAADAASYDLYYASGSPSTPTAGTNATENVTTKTPTITGLTASTTYKIWVRSVCDADHKSAWVALGTTSFTTSAAEPEALVHWTMNLNTATWGAASTETSDETNITSIATSRTGGNSGASTSATAKVSMASAEVADESNPSNYAAFTFTVNAAKKVVPEKVTCEVFNVSTGDRTYKAQISDSNGHVYNSTNTVAVSTEATLTPATFTFASDLVLTGNVTVKVYAWKTSGSPTDFRMGADVKLFGEVQNAADYTVTHTMSNVTKSAGATSVKEGNNYTATYAGAGGYALPSTITVTIGGDTKTVDTDYTWNQSTGVVSIPGNKVTGNIVITVTGVAIVHHDVTFSLTNVAYSSGDNQGDDAATEGSAFSTVFVGTTGYNLPSTITVTIDGDPATAGTDYTWDQGTGTLTIPGAKITGDITVSITGEEIPATKDIYYGHVKITDGALVREIPSGATQFFTNIGGTVANNTEISLSSTPSTTGMYYNSNNLTDAELSKSSNWGTSSGSNRYVRGLKFANGTTYTLALGTKVASVITFYGWCGSASKTMTVGGEEFTSSSTKNTFAKHEFIKTGGFTGNVSITQDGDFYGILVITIQTATPCTTPVIPTLSNQSLCEGADIAAWDATVTNASAISDAGETVTYSWKKKGNATELANTASFDLGASAAESQAGTYVVTVTVSKTGYASSTATKEVTLSVTDGIEVTGITADKATVYPTNSVTLTATASADAAWQWYTCSNAEGAGAAIISGAESASYTIASAGAADTYYYKAVATGSCGTAERVYTLVVSPAAGGDCFHFVSVIPAGNITVSSNTSLVTPTHATTLEGGTMKVGSSEMTIAKDYGLKLESSKYVTVTLDAALEAGNVVIVKGTSGTKGYGITINGVNFYDADNKTFDVSYTVVADDGLEGQTALTVSKYSGNSYLQEVKITGCGESCTDPEVTASADNTTACVSTSVTFTATGAHASATYQWQKLDGTWTNISGATASTYNIASVVAGDAGKYRVIATHDCSRTSNEVTLSVPSAPDFGSTVPASVSVMQTIALSINTVEATDAVKYRWYKSADDTWDAGDTEIGTNKELIKAYDGEAIGSPSYYIFCRAQNACGTTTSSAIAVNVTTYVEEDCATRGNEGEAQFGFENTSMTSGTYNNETAWSGNQNSKYLTYIAPTGKNFAKATVTIATSGGSNAAYAVYNGSSWTYYNITGMSSSWQEKEFTLPANTTKFQIGRRLDDKGTSSGTFYLHEACFTYTETCTATTVTPSTASVDYEMGDTWSNPTFSLSPAVGTLTYTSSNEDIASVDDDGTVTFNGEAGTVTITASYAGGTISATDYCASSGSYTINVSCPGGAPKIVPGGTVNMSGCNSSVTLNAKTQAGADFADGTYQWFRNGEEIDGATSSSYTATQAGIYTVERTNASGCTTPSTNSATVTSETTEPEVERLVPFQYYHVDKTYTDYMKMRHLFAVKNSGTLDGKHFKMYVSRNGGDPTDVTSSNALAIWPNADGRVDTVMVDLNKLNGKYAKGDELVYTCKAIDCNGNISETYKSTIQMHVIDTDTATLALICSGANGDGTRTTSKLVVGGDFLTGYNKADLCVQTGNTSFDKTQEWVLYTRLKENYIVTPVNGYAPFYKLNYEPFDILFLTDYPKASKSDAAATVLDDMADLCDYRPLFTFKTHMVHKTPSKWAAKGFMATPEVPKQSRLRLNIVCYAHPMFDDLKEVSDQIQKDASDHSQIVYTMLTGPGHEGSKGMQGFPIDAAEGFVTIGLVHNDATAADDTPSDGYVTWTPGSSDVMLVAAAERQVNLEARMILFSVNCGAQSKLTETGRQVVLKSLEYLLSDATITPVADCSFTFTNGAGNSMTYEQYKAKCPACTGTIGDGKWSTAGNWAPDWILQPSKDTEVKIAAPVTVDMPHARVRTVRIVEGGRIEIPAGSGLEVTSTIRHMDGSEIYPTDVNDLKIGASSTGNGTLIFNNNTGDTKAGVAMYSKAFITDFELETEAKNYQYIGSPYVSANAAHNYYDSWLYYWNGTKWKVVKNGGPMTPWTGYCITQVAAGTTYWMDGTLTATGTVDIAVGAGQDMVVGNSWTAPLYIKAFTDDDFENLVGNVYFFNTGIEKDHTLEGNMADGDRYAGSTYVTVPIHAASYTGDSLISSLQGFFVTSSGSAGTLHLDYDRHVRPAKNRNILSGEMHAPKRRTAIDTNEPEVVKIKVSGENYDDRLVLLARADFSAGFDNGWDGDKWDGNEASLYIYSKDERGVENSVSAIPEMEGTVVGFRAGEDEAYTFTFEYLNSDEPLYLFDTENNSYTQIVTGGIYRFFTNDKEKHERFVLTRHAPQIATGCENLDGGEGAKAKKLLIEDKMFIMVNGLLYDATGKVVK